MVQRYVTADEDSARWEGFRFRQGDVVVSSRSKHGTTWVQRIGTLLVFRSRDLPEPLGRLSPWLDWLVEPLDEVVARLDDQDHRRIIKTHTPLDGLPLDDRATWIVVARHPLDAALSLFHQGDNIHREPVDRPPVIDWLRAWIEADPDPRRELDSLPGVMLHLGDAWSRRSEANILMIRYEDLIADLPGQMKALAEALGIEIDDGVEPALVEAARFDAMRADAERVAPDPGTVLRDRTAFFRRGRPGAAAELVTEADLRRYEQRAAALAPPDLLAWLHGTD